MAYRYGNRGQQMLRVYGYSYGVHSRQGSHAGYTDYETLSGVDCPGRNIFPAGIDLRVEDKHIIVPMLRQQWRDKTLVAK